MNFAITTRNIQQRATILNRAFDSEFITLSNVAIVQAHTKHDASLLDTICTNVRNDMETLSVCTKELR